MSTFPGLFPASTRQISLAVSFCYTRRYNKHLLTIEMQTSYAKIGECPDPKIWQSPCRKRKKQDKLSIAGKSMTYFKIVECTKEKVMCKCQLCPPGSKPINATKSYNMGNHLKNIHSDLFYEKIAINVKEPLPVKRLRILQNAVEIVSVNGRPFSWLLDSGYQAGLTNKLHKLNRAGIGINFSDNSLPEIKDHLKQMAEKVRDKIRQELRGRFVCIMADICGKNNYRSIFGVSAQFIKDGEITIRSLGMIELKESHTGVYLAAVLFGRLTEFNIEKCQVLCIVVDNGANVIKMVEDFNKITDIPNTDLNVLNLQASRALIHEFNAIDDETTDNEIQLALTESDNITDDQALDILFHEERLNESADLLSAAATEFIGADSIWNTTGVNCTAHTLQLVIKDALAKLDRHHLNVIELSHRIAKFFRLSSTRNKMNQIGLNYNLPRLDCSTRWSSTCIMLSSVVDCKAAIEHYASDGNKICQLMTRKWQILREIVYLLQIPLRVTIAVQNHDFTLSDVYGAWVKMRLHLRACSQKTNYKTKLADHLLDAISTRNDTIFKNPFMSCAIFLDPRFRGQIISDEFRLEQTKNMLSDLWRRSNQQEILQNSNTSSNIDFEFDEETELEKYLSRSDVAATNNNSNVQHVDIESLLDSFDPDRLPSNSSVLEFWEASKNIYRELYKLAMMVYCIPPTEVQVERDFSRLNYIFSNRRSQLDACRLEDIMAININSDIFNLVKSEELQSELAKDA